MFKTFATRQEAEAYAQRHTPHLAATATEVEEGDEEETVRRTCWVLFVDHGGLGGFLHKASEIRDLED